MFTPSHLSEALLRVSEGQQGITFVTSADNNQFVSYRELYEQSLQTLGNLQSLGLGKGDKVLLYLDDNQKFLEVFWACILGGIIPVPLAVGNQNTHKLKIVKVWEQLSPCKLITTEASTLSIEKFLTNQQPAQLQLMEDILQVENLSTTHLRGKVADVSQDDIAFLQFTSGSTGNPKGVVLTHDNLVHNARDIISASEITKDDRMLSWMPLTHDMGMICFHLTGVLANLNQYLMPTDLFIRRPILWLSKTNEFRISLLYSPNFGLSYFLSAFQKNQEQYKHWDLSSIRLIYNGAEPISYDLCKKFEKTLSHLRLPENVIFPGYGMAEASVAVTLSQVSGPVKQVILDRDQVNIGQQVEYVDEHHDNSISFVTVGTSIPHCQVTVVDDQEQPLGDHKVGHVRIKGKNVTSGYYHLPEVNQTLFNEEGWLKTGDLGFMIGDELVITGRFKNLIIVNGQNYYPQDIEASLMQIDGVDLGKVVVANLPLGHIGYGKLVVFVLFKRKPAAFREVEAMVRTMINDHYGLMVHHVVPVRKIPKTTSGKIQNFQLMAQYLGGEFDLVLEQLDKVDSLSEEADDEEVIRYLLRSHVGIPEIDITESLLSRGMNSLQSLSLSSEISERFNVMLNASDLFRHDSIEAILALITQLKNQDKTETAKVVAHAPERDFYPLSNDLLSIYHVEQVSEPYAPYNVSVAYKASSSLDAAKLQQAVRMLMQKHPMLTARFFEMDEKVVFAYDPSVVDRFEVMVLDTAMEAVQARHLLEELAHQRFDLSSAPLFKISIVKAAAGIEYLLFNFHHLIIDGWSVNLFQQELAAIYAALKKGAVDELQSIPHTYHDYLLWEQEQKKEPLSLMSADFWKKELVNLPKLDFHLSKKRPRKLSYQGASVFREFTGEQANRLRSLSKEQEGTLFVSAVAALNVVLALYCGQKEIAVGTDTSGRLAQDFRKQIGYFLKTLAIRTDVDFKTSFRQHYAIVKQKVLEVLTHQQLGINQLEGHGHIRNDLSRAPYFDVLILMQNFNEGAFLKQLDQEVTLEHVDLSINSSLLDLCFEFYDYGSKLATKVHYNPELFSQDLIENLIAKFHWVVDAFVSQPDGLLTEFGFADEQEKQQILANFNGESRKDQRHDVLQLLHDSIRQHGEAPCLNFRNEVRTYAEVGHTSDQIASLLRDQHGIGRGDRVGIYMDRSVNQVLSLIALMKIGAVFVPIDAEFPEERIKYIVSDAALIAILTEDRLLSDLESVAHMAITIDALTFDFEQKGIFTGVANDPEELVYINYTSGTTGKPKGVEIARSSLADYTATFSQYFALSKTDKVIYQSSLTFDTAYEEIFPALASGSELIISPEGGKDVPALLDLIQGQQATVLSTTPLVLDLINRQPELVASLRVIISGGDKLQASHISNLFSLAKIYNTYGPTEGTICATYHAITTLEDVGAIGKPLPNRNVYILDDSMNLLPVGVAGQIAISGAGIAKGYLNKPVLTAKHFVDNPFDEQSRLYLTGDLAYWRADGSIQFVGRQDHQIKISGKRVETSEIEQAISQVSGVGSCVVKYFTQKRPRLVAFYEASTDLAGEQIRNEIRKSLPDYMVPEAFVQVEQMPLNVNGKLDRNALTEDLIVEELTKYDKEVIATSEEKTIIKLWEEILEVKGISPYDNFFELGGYSLKANEFLIALSSQCAVRISFAEFFKDATPASLAQHLQAADSKGLLPLLKPLKSEKTALLSNAEKRFWVIDQFQEDKRSYTLNWFYEVNGAFDVDCFRDAFAILVERHEILRTSYVQQEADVIREIEAQVSTDRWYTFIDLSDDPAADDKIRHQEALIRDWEFDLAQAPLFSMMLLKSGTDQYRVYLAIHHIICDGYSIEILVEELSEIYHLLKNNDPVNDDKPSITYRDFVHWQNQMISSGQLEIQKDYWHQQVNRDDSPIELPVDHQRPPIQTYNGAVLEFAVPHALFKAVQKRAESHQVSTFSFLLSAFKLLMHRYTGFSEVQVGMVTANRDVPGTESLIGLLLNTVVLNTRIEKGVPFSALIQAVNTQLVHAMDHHHYPFERLVEDLVEERDLSRSPLFNIMVGYQNRSSSERHLQALDGVAVRKIDIEKNASQFDLSVDFIEVDDRLTVELEYNTDLYDRPKIQALNSHLLNLLEALSKDSHQPISDYNYLGKQELQTLVPTVSDQLPIQEHNVAELFRKTASKYARQLAVTFGDDQLSYAELDELSDQVAGELYNTYGLINQPVGVMYPKSINAIVMIVALLKNGCPYVPIDNDSPAERANHIIAQSEIEYLLTNVERTGLNNSLTQLTPERLLTGKTVQVDADINYATAYITFTSGSTGLPKGVKVSHQNLLSASYSWTSAYQLAVQRPVVLQLANIAFDVFSGDLCRALLNGGELVLCTREQQLDFEQLYNLIESKSVTLLETTPALGVPFANYLISNDLHFNTLELLILGSDALPSSEFERIRKYFDGELRLVNSFGVTEATIDSSFFEGAVNIDFVQHTPIGKPLANTSMFILDPYLNVLPAGYDGELAIGGPAVSEGYVNDPERTSEKFVGLPALSSQPVYRTGDQARLLEDGNFVFLGRLDDQIKIRGHRVEPGEIEAVALQYEELEQAVVLAHRIEDITRLTIYTNPEVSSRTDFHTFLQGNLPSYMVPTYLIGQSDRFQLTSNGKVDRKVLRIPQNSDLFVQQAYRAPETGMETVLAELWSDLLNVPQIGRDDHFFELGGDSIKAASMMGMLARDHQVKLTFSALFEDARLMSVAAKIGKTQLADIPKAKETKYYPLSTAQRSIWLLEQSADLQGSYNMPIVYEINGAIDDSLLASAFLQLIARHDILRTSIVVEGNEPKLHVKSSGTDFTLVVQEGEEGSLSHAIDDLVNFTFALDLGPLFTATLLKVAADKSYLLVNLHHLISDGWSTGIMIRELSDFYKGNTKAIQPLSIQYQDFSSWQNGLLANNELKEQKAFWFDQLNQAVSPLPLTGDFKRPAQKTFSGKTVKVVLNDGINAQLKATARRSQVTYFTVILSAVRALLYRYSNQRECIIGTATSGRDYPALANQLGCFVNSLPLPIPVEGAKSFKELLQEVKGIVSEARANADYPFDQLVDDLNLDKDPSRSVLFDVMVVLQNTPESQQRLDFGADISISEHALTRTSSKYDLTFNFEDAGDTLGLEVEYNTDIYQQERIEDLLRHLAELMKALIAKPELAITDVAYLSEVDQQSNMLSGEETTHSIDLVEAIEIAARQHSEKEALIWPKGKLSYAQLTAWSDKVAIWLDESKASGCVAVDVTRNWQTIVALLGILKSGRAYVPVSLIDPKARLSHQLLETGATCVLTSEKAKKLYDGVSVTTIEEIGKEISISKPYSRPELTGRPLIYTLYTSGSTGKPKGAKVYRDSFNNLLAWYQNELELSPESKVLLLAPPTFDLCQKNIFASLCTGGTLVLPGEGALDFIGLVDQLQEWKVDAINCAPATFYPLLEQAKRHSYSCLGSLKSLVLGGEPINQSAFESWVDSGHFNARIMNSYGPTECTDVVSFHWLTDCEDENIPIGLPVPNTQLYVLDEHRKILPAGNIGDLYIAGVCLGGGYVDITLADQAKFIEGTEEIAVPLYKTGDKARIGHDGLLYFHGRADDQIKLNGYRIELGEIEQTILDTSEVERAVVKVTKDHQGLNDVIVCYLESEVHNKQAFYQNLKKQLPGYMLPSYLVQNEPFALNRNGKIDRKRLRRVTEVDLLGVNVYSAPSNDLERDIADIWQEVLSVERVGREDDFFAIGGTSLKALRAVSLIYQRYSLKSTLGNILEKSTLKDFCQTLQQATQTSQQLVERPESIPLSPAQRGMWHLVQTAGALEAYNMSACYQIEGAVDIHQLNHATNRLIERHEILRTSFEFVDDFPVQITHPHVENDKVHVRAAEDDLDGQINALSAHRFDIENGPLINITLLQVNDELNYLHFNTHHLIADGFSVDLIVKEYCDFYNGNATDYQPLQVQFADYSVSQTAFEQSERHHQSLSYWSQKLGKGAPVFDLPTDFTRPSVKTYNGSTVELSLDEQLTAGVEAYIADTNKTSFEFYLSCLIALLHRYTSQEEMVIGIPVSGRNQADLLDQIGYYVNTVAHRSKVSETDTFDQLFQQTKQRWNEDLKHSEVAFQTVVEHLELPADRSRSQVFDVMFAYYDEAVAEPGLKDLKVIRYEAASDFAKYDLTFNIYKLGEALKLEIEYNTDLYGAERVTQLAEHFVGFAMQALHSPDTAVAAIKYYDKNSLHKTWPPTHLDHAFTFDLITHFEQMVEQYPKSTALEWSGGSMSYEALNSASNKIATYVNSLPVEHQAIVAVAAERSPLSLVAILGILKAGSAYLPVAPDLPVERKKYMLTIAAVDAYLTVDEEEEIHSTQLQVDQLLSDKGLSTENTQATGSGELIYVLFTSGSTGQPKGAKVTRKAFNNLVSWYINELALSPDSTSLLMAPLSFDLAQKNLYANICTGGTIVIPDQGPLNYTNIIGQIATHEVTHINCAPAAFYPIPELVLESGFAEIQSLKAVILGGEAINTSRLMPWIESHPLVRIMNSYGPTECTDVVSYHWLTEENLLSGQVPIGSPIRNAELLLLDAHGTPVPKGSIGEVAIVGLCVGHGYVGDEALTREKFRKNAILDNRVVYATGDRGRLLADGTILYLGRNDYQVKVNGQRIEPGEIETVIQGFTGVTQSLVVVQRDEVNQLDRLVAFVSPMVSDRAALKAEMIRKLPAFMIPSHLVELPGGFPLNTNGKIDRARLPEVSTQDLFIQTEFEPPQTELEVKIAEIWKTLLGGDRIGRSSNFFELGGDSIKAVRFIGRLKKELNLTVSHELLYTAPLLRDVAEAAVIGQYKPIPQVENQAHYPLSFAQKGLWLLMKSVEDNGAYNIPAAFTIKGPLRVAAFRQAFAGIVEAHDSLRTVFVTRDGLPFQSILPVDHDGLQVEIIEEHNTAVDTFIEQLNAVRFDLEKGPLFVSKLVRLSAEEHLFLFNIHHLISDGWSLGLMMEELTKRYNGQEVPVLPVQFKDYSHWQHEEASHESATFWDQHLDGTLPVFDFPAKQSRGKTKSFEGRTIKRKIATGLTTMVQAFCQKKGMTMPALMLASLRILLYRYTRQTDIIIGIPDSGRRHPDLDKQLGFYVNTLPLRSQLEESASCTRVVDNIRKTLRECQQHAQMPLDAIVERLSSQTDRSRSPLFDVLFVFQNTPFGASALSDMSGLDVSKYELVDTTSKFDMTFSISAATEMEVEFSYNHHLYEDKMMENLLQHYEVVTRLLIEEYEKETAIDDLDMLDIQSGKPAVSDDQIDYLWNEHDLIATFERVSASMPLHTALAWKSGSMSFEELNLQSNRVAHYLHQTDAPRVVGVESQRNWQLMTSILGILKSGRAYLPIDSELPKERIALMLDHANTDLFITTSDKQIYETGLPTEQILSDPGLPTDNLKIDWSETDQVYTLYTSGSTGIPKGARVKRSSFNNLMHWYIDEIHLNESSNVLLIAPPSFDLCQKNLFASLMVGGTLFLPGAGRLDYFSLAEAIHEHQLTELCCAPSAFYPLVDIAVEGNFQKLSSLKSVILGGEVINTQKLSRWINSHYCNAEILNYYGPTECTDAVSYHWINEEDYKTGLVPIGRPLPNTQLDVMGSNGRLLPDGCIGELYISGVCVSKGYVRAADNKVFCNPEDLGKNRAYRTGDLVRKLPNGDLLFLGRIDHQIKLNGQRLEPAEIEHVAKKYGGVSVALVQLMFDEQLQREVLVCYVDAAIPDREGFRSHLSSFLPAYMMPTYLVEIPTGFKLNTNGKLDRKQLPAFGQEALLTSREVEAPVGTQEELLQQIWQELLNTTDIGRNENFFELGGDSLKAVQLVAKLRENGWKANVETIFNTENIRFLAQELQPLVKTSYQGLVTGRQELSPVQEFFFRTTDQFHHYNQSVVLRFNQSIDERLLAETLENLANHHDALRMRFHLQGDLQFEISAEFDAAEHLEVIETESQEEIETFGAGLQSSLDIENGPLWKYGLVKGPQFDSLIMVIHHLLVDGVSWRILLTDLETIYLALEEGRPVKLPPKTDSFVLWVDFMKKTFDEKSASFWDALPAQPTENAPLAEENTVSNSKTVTCRLDADTTNTLLRSSNKKYGASITELLTAALMHSLQRQFPEIPLSVMMEGHGRPRNHDAIEVSRTVGWFTSFYPLTINMESASSGLQTMIRAVKEALRAIPEEGRYFLPYANSRELKHAQMPQISFNYLGQFDDVEQTKLFTLKDESYGHTQAAESQRMFQWDVIGIVNQRQMEFSIDYNSNWHSEEQMGVFIRDLQESLQLVVQILSDGTDLMSPADFTYPQLRMSDMEMLCSRYSIEDVWPLTGMQMAMFYHTILEQDSDSYFAQISYDLRGELVIDHLQTAYRELVARHPVLRSAFLHKGLTEPVQLAVEAIEPDFSYSDLTNFSDLDNVINEFTDQDKLQGFDFEKPGLIRLKIFKTANAVYRFTWTYHHLILDGWSLALLTNEFFDLYHQLQTGAEKHLPEPVTPVNYFDWLNARDHKEAADYWHSYLDGYNQEGGLVANFGELASTERQMQEMHFDVSAELVTNLTEVSNRLAVTDHVVLKTLWGILIAKYLSSDDVVFGEVASVRSDDIKDGERMVGMFINTIVARISYEQHTRLDGLIRDVHQKSLETTAYQHFPVSELAVADQPVSNWIDHVFVFQNYPFEENSTVAIENYGEESKELFISGLESREYNNFDLLLVLTPGNQWQLKVQYDESKLSSDFIEKLVADYFSLFIQIKDTKKAIADFSIEVFKESQSWEDQFNESF